MSAQTERDRIMRTYPGVHVRVADDHPLAGSDDLEIRDTRPNDDPTITGDQKTERQAGNVGGDSYQGHWYLIDSTTTATTFA